MSAREHAVLADLASLPRGWVRPMDIGGTNGSHHAQTLARLCRKGLAKRRPRPTLMNVLIHPKRPRSYRYRITRAGRAALRNEPRSPSSC